jgi:hypothetical protein
MDAISFLKESYKFASLKYQNLFLEYKVHLKPRYGHGMPPHKELYSIIDLYRNEYSIFIEKILSYKEKIWEIKNAARETDVVKPVFNNGFLPGLDIASIYTMMSEYKPSKYIEIGSGNSTKVAFKAKEDQKLSTEIISIDPQPRAEIDKLANKVVRQPFEDINFEFLDKMEENDILFVDNSHRIFPNSDSMVFFLEVLPRLRKGVIVHIHDVYLPYDYPQFMCDRFYSEQYGLAMYLLANPTKFKTLFPCFFVHEDLELAQMLNPLWKHHNLDNVEKHGCSYWLIINK